MILNSFFFRKKYLTILFFFFMDTYLSAQNFDKKFLENNNDPVTEMSITYGDSIYIGKINIETKWQINTGKKTIAKGHGPTLNSFVFKEPGIYNISIAEYVNEEVGMCNHTHLPSQIRVNVSSVKMKYHFEELQLSDHPKVAQDTKGIILTVPVTISVYNKQNLKFKDKSMFTTGIQTNIVAIGNNQLKLKTGKQLLTYYLSGKANAPVYVMFNFLDINNKIHAYSYTKMIK